MRLITHRGCKTGIDMKIAKIIIHEPLINRLIGSELDLLLNDKANVLDAINEVDRQIANKGGFPLPDYRSLLHMVYNPVANRFYKQVAVTAQDEQNKMVNVRENPKKELLERTTIILIPAGGCISDWEEVVDYKDFLKALSER
jgi:hypothetical protein